MPKRLTPKEKKRRLRKQKAKKHYIIKKEKHLQGEKVKRKFKTSKWSKTSLKELCKLIGLELNLRSSLDGAGLDRYFIQNRRKYEF